MTFLCRFMNVSGSFKERRKGEIYVRVEKLLEKNLNNFEAKKLVAYYI